MIKTRVFSIIFSFVLLVSSATMASAETLLAATGDTSGFYSVSTPKTVTLSQNCDMVRIRALNIGGSTSEVGYVAIGSQTINNVMYDNVLHTYTKGSTDQNVTVSIPAGTYTVQFHVGNASVPHQASILFYKK